MQTINNTFIARQQFKNTTKFLTGYLLLSLAAAISAETTLPTTQNNLFDLSLEQLSQTTITTASKVPEALNKTAATVSIITATEIRRSGARTIYDALEKLPGINTGLNQYTDHFITFRGMRTTWSERILMLLDGHLINDVRSGSATFQFLDSLPVENIARIEVVRSPGSALYGANAYLGIINIITKKPEEIDTSIAKVSGEFEADGTVARRYNFMTAGNFAQNWQGNLNLNLVSAAGASLNVSADALGRSGNADQAVNRVDIQATLQNDSFTVKSRFLQRKAGDGFGSLAILNQQSSQEVDYFFLDAEYKSKLSSDTGLTLRVYYDHQESDNDYVLIPAGIIPAASAYFPWNPTGLLGNALAQESIIGTEARIDFRGIANHTFTTGLTWRNERLHDIALIANFDPAPLAVPTDVSSYYNWIDPANRDIASLYLQDLWDVRPDLSTTLGIRYDHYSDFGSSVNPRLGLVWQLTSKTNARLTYGQAFRAPSFVQQYIKNNPGQQGNPNLVPEDIETWEAGLSWQNQKAMAGLTLYYSRLNNLIDIPAASIQFQNLGKATAHGLEIEASLQLKSGTNLVSNYSYSDVDYSGLTPSLLSPQHQFNLSLNVPVTEVVNWNIHTHWQSDTLRSSGDTRPVIESSWVLNTTLSVKSGAWDINIGIYNLSDSKSATPAPINTIVNDFTAPGRSFVIGVQYKF